MPAEQFSDVKFEIGHVLFLEIVDYSKQCYRWRPVLHDPRFQTLCQEAK